MKPLAAGSLHRGALHCVARQGRHIRCQAQLDCILLSSFAHPRAFACCNRCTWCCLQCKGELAGALACCNRYACCCLLSKRELKLSEAPPCSCMSTDAASNGRAAAALWDCSAAVLVKALHPMSKDCLQGRTESGQPCPANSTRSFNRPEYACSAASVSPILRHTDAALQPKVGPIGALRVQRCLQGREDLKLSEDTAMQLYGLKQLRVVREEKLDTKCFLAWNEDILVLAFRGTASTRNAISDLQVFSECNTARL